MKSSSQAEPYLAEFWLDAKQGVSPEFDSIGSHSSSSSLLFDLTSPLLLHPILFKLTPEHNKYKMMDSMPAIYPPLPEITPEKLGTSPMEPAATAPPMTAQAQAAAPAQAPAAPQPISAISNFTLTSPSIPPPPPPPPPHHHHRQHHSAQLDYPQLYSPTRAEIETHPIIIKRHSPARDEEVATGLGSAAAEDESHSRQDITATSSTMADKGIEKGDEVSWQWSGGRPGGAVDEVKDHGELSVTSKKGNEIKKKADPEDPAVKISRPGNDVVKRAHELEIDEKGPGNEAGASEEKKDESKDAEAANGDASSSKTGEKRKADDDDAEADADAGKEDDKPAKAKKGKTAAAPKANGEKAAPKKKGRPAANKDAANGTSSKAKAEPKKKREPKKAATESGQPRRSGRNAEK
ncbi:hypothetical protein LTS16_018043 [Friedmanniomyces endolithicus]|nr:hypothetical protein LTR35_016767 [Friedmanniomyces endolithicus]KAK0273211.1 hypothetical protein LTS00_015890 [Friedmanniomyces endolithicus]KAK0904952.1 hypothetical protein LTR57_018511 [Friedmanniomyces endolithicus]KAK0977032.1 hypothetical protein LTR54_016328 [Friedmanniomyces endolithicus]KAK1001279.1 hypothetical protein LTS01_004753 [Friedmanniomyces endolithicus]